MIEVCREEETDLLLIAGDLFHRQPLLRELREVDYLFSTLEKTQVVLIAGNHDYVKPNSYYKTFDWGEHVHMLLSPEMDVVQIPELDTAIYGLSYHSKEITEPLYHEFHQFAFPHEPKYRILLAHGGDSKHIPIKRERLMELPYDYIALGHIHKPQELHPCRITYAGALEPIDKNDTGGHGYIKGNLSENGCKTVFIPAAAREYVHEAIESDESMTGFLLRTKISKLVESRGIQHIYKLQLRGYRNPDVEFDFSGMDMYGNIIEIEDTTKPAYDFEKMQQQNVDNLLGKFIQSFEGCSQESVEYHALCEGVRALVETRRG